MGIGGEFDRAVRRAHGQAIDLGSGYVTSKAPSRSGGGGCVAHRGAPKGCRVVGLEDPPIVTRVLRKNHPVELARKRHMMAA